MRKIITTTFVSLDGVMQAPGGPDEDRSGDFKYGGWSFNYWDEVGGAVMSGFMQLPFEMLLGRRTYDIFAGYWPNAKSDQEIAHKFNSTTKYVVSHQPLKLSWQNSVLVSGDVVTQLKQLKTQNKPDLWVHGSGNLIQTLLANDLVDRMVVWTCPATIGGGKKLFSEGTKAANWKLIDSKLTTKGVVISTYEPDGPLRVGSFAE